MTPGPILAATSLTYIDDATGTTLHRVGLFLTMKRALRLASVIWDQ